MSDEVDPEIRGVAEAIFDELLSDLILTTAISAHREIKRGRVICGTCGTKCRSHLPLAPPAASTNTLQPPASQPYAGPSKPASRTASPPPTPLQASGSSSMLESRTAGYTVGPEKGTGGASGIASGSGRMDGNGNVFFDCLVCGRAIVSTRYAPHLSTCLGLNGSTRRGASRMAAAKARRLGTNDRSSPSPHVQGSENGDSDVESANGKKGRKSLLSGNGKRRGSPNKPKNGKKSKTASGTATPTIQFPRQALPPSRLGRPPTIRQPNPINLVSPVSSPESSALGAGTRGTKSLPGMGAGGSMPSTGDAESGSGHTEVEGDVFAAEEVPGDESSEGADDDY